MKLIFVTIAALVIWGAIPSDVVAHNDECLDTKFGRYCGGHCVEYPDNVKCSGCVTSEHGNSCGDNCICIASGCRCDDPTTAYPPTVYPPTVYPHTVYPHTVYPHTVYPPTVYSPTVYSPTAYPPTVYPTTVQPVVTGRNNPAISKGAAQPIDQQQHQHTQNTSSPVSLIAEVIVSVNFNEDEDDFLETIAKSNPTLNTTEWRVYNHTSSKDHKHQRWNISIDIPSIPALEVISFNPYFFNSTIQINLQNYTENNNRP